MASSDSTKTAVLETKLDCPLLHKGKVRDIYDADGKLLIVTTDRLSAFDVVFGQGIPDKGKVLTQVSNFWARSLPACNPYHLISDTLDGIAKIVPQVQDDPATYEGRSILVEKLEMSPVECVVRGFLVGSGWKDYQKTGEVCGHKLPEGLQLGDELPEPLFTPATKAQVGDHDENISFGRVVEMVGEQTAEELKQRSIDIYNKGRIFARERGFILVDTKFEFGKRPDGTMVLADEALTPDSSRYWDVREAEATARGKTPPSFDKQIVRDYLETLDWNKAPPAPALPQEILNRTAARYHDLLERLTKA